MNQNYQDYYNITLLDDLHNYFPDILYATHRFNSVRDLLEYIQDQVHEQFDIFSSARRSHLRNERLQQQQQQQQHQQSRQQVSQPTAVQPPATTQPRDVFRLVFNLDDNLPQSPVVGDDLTSLVNILTTLGSAVNQTTMEPVIVRPTSQQIQSGSSIVEVSSSNDSRCAICQENLINESNHQIRRLTHCQHMFHDPCILRWFNRNVRCPTCRHDIRDVYVS